MAVRRELVAAMKRMARPVRLGELKHELLKSSGSVLQLLYALKDDGIVDRQKLHGVWLWRLTGKPLVESGAPVTRIRSAAAANCIHDHRALAEALGMCTTPPQLPAGVRSHTAPESDW